MGFAWSHTTYAMWHGMIFNFEDKWDLDYFLAHAEDAKRISAAEAWKSGKDFIRIFSSRCLGANRDRRKCVKEWKDEVKHRRIAETL